MALEEALVSQRQEREPVEIVLVVDFDAFGKAGRRIAATIRLISTLLTFTWFRFGAEPPPSRRPLGKLESIAASSVITSPV